MLWLDPQECLAAQDALQRGNPAEAARLLLSSKNPEHRTVRRLLSEAGQRLAEQAQQQFEAGELEAAEACLNLAAQCLPLQGEALACQRKVAQALDQQRRHQAWAAEQLERARRLAEGGRLHTALDVLKPLAALPVATPLRLQVEQQLGSFRRHVEACQQALQADQPEAAHRHWQRAQAISPESPELVELAQKIARALSNVGGAAEKVVAVEDRAQRVQLDSLALVVSTAEVVLGTVRGEGVHVPLYDQLHGRHAVFLRDRHGWQLVPCRDRHGRMCPVWVNGEIAAGACRLADGCLIRLGNGNCVWRFRLPVRQSATAVLEPAEGSRPCLSVGRGQLQRVVLLDEELWVRPAAPAHLIVPELPCRQFVLRWRQGVLGWEAEGGRVGVELPGRIVDEANRQVFLPCRLVIESRLEEAELLGREAAGCGPVSPLVFELTNPAPQSRRTP